MFERLQNSARFAVRRAAFSGGAALCLLVGAGFLTVAGWLALVAITSAQVAALIVGCIWVGAGFVLLALGQMRPKVDVPPVERNPNVEAAANGASLAEAFIYGLESGRRKASNPPGARR